MKFFQVVMVILKFEIIQGSENFDQQKKLESQNHTTTLITHRISLNFLFSWFSLHLVSSSLLLSLAFLLLSYFFFCSLVLSCLSSFVFSSLFLCLVSLSLSGSVSVCCCVLLLLWCVVCGVTQCAPIPHAHMFWHVRMVSTHTETFWTGHTGEEEGSVVVFHR